MYRTLTGVRRLPTCSTHQEPGDGVFFYIPNNYCYRYYVRRAQDEHRVATAPDTLYPPAQWQPLSPRRN